MSQIDFRLYKLLSDLSGIFSVYPNDSLQKETALVMQGLQDKHFCVAVAGEFRRGKSSLINALLGMPVLPVDIEPTTATVNRITFGLKPAAVIHFKDGSQKNVPIEDLASYVTKLTAESAKTAETVREAVIQYPTELCAHNVDIIDTPGLNDTESMTAVTDDILQKVDAVIIAVKCTMPYSDTECQWVAKMLSLPNLQHIIFAVTCVDLIRKKDRERSLAAIRERILTNTLARVQQDYGDHPEILEKARRILNENDLCMFPVSAQMALDAFDTGDYEQMEDSLLPAFKKELVTILNAQQQLAFINKTFRLVAKTKAWFSSLSTEDPCSATEQETEALQKADNIQKQYFQERNEAMGHAVQAASGNIDPLFRETYSADQLFSAVQHCVIRHLSALAVSTPDAISMALANAGQEIRTVLVPQFDDSCIKAVNAAIVRCSIDFLQQRRELLAPAMEIGSELILEDAVLRQPLRDILLKGPDLRLPEFSLNIPKALLGKNVMNLVTPVLKLFTSNHVRVITSAIPSYTQTAMFSMLSPESEEISGKFTEYVLHQKGALSEKSRQHSQQHAAAETLLAGLTQEVRNIRKEFLG